MANFRNIYYYIFKIKNMKNIKFILNMMKKFAYVKKSFNFAFKNNLTFNL